MNVRPSILCPVDLSAASPGHLRLAAAIAEHFVARLIVLTVETSGVTAAQAGEPGSGETWQAADAAIATYVANVFQDRAIARALCEYEGAVGDPATEILRVSRERSCDLIVMASRGGTGEPGPRLGSTTERVLRETTVPVLVMPASHPADVDVEQLSEFIGCLIAPVDLSPASQHQVRVAGGLAAALGVPLALVHALEPSAAQTGAGGGDPERRAGAVRRLAELASAIDAACRREAIVERGEPATAIASVVRERHAGLIVMGLHDSPRPGPRMGSVTYRTLCQATALVLALPPRIQPIPRSTEMSASA